MSEKKEWVLIPSYPKFETDRVSVRSVKNKNIQSKQGSKYRIYHENGERHTISLEDIIALVDGKPIEKPIVLEVDLKEQLKPVLEQAVKTALPKDLAEAKALTDHKPDLTDKSKTNLAKDKTEKPKTERATGIKSEVMKYVEEGKTLNQIMELRPEWKRNTVYIIILKHDKAKLLNSEKI